MANHIKSLSMRKCQGEAWHWPHLDYLRRMSKEMQLPTIVAGIPSSLLPAMLQNKVLWVKTANISWNFMFWTMIRSVLDRNAEMLVELVSLTIGIEGAGPNYGKWFVQLDSSFISSYTVRIDKNLILWDRFHLQFQPGFLVDFKLLWLAKHHRLPLQTSNSGSSCDGRTQLCLGTQHERKANTRSWRP